MRHLYIFEDGTAAIHNEPTPEDYRCADNGILSIFRFVPGSPHGEIQQYNPNLTRPVKFEPVPKAVLTSDGDDHFFHEPEQSES